MDKNELRAAIRAQGTVDVEVNAQVVEGLFEWLSRRLPGTVSGFLAMSWEVDVSPLFERLPGWRWVLPRVEPDGSMTFRDKDVARETHRFGMSQPADMGPMIAVYDLDVFLTPGVAFDERGGRLGNGGGFYDGVLEVRRPDSQAVGVTIEERVIEEVPMSEHDRRVDWLATEAGVKECSTKS